MSAESDPVTPEDVVATVRKFVTDWRRNLAVRATGNRDDAVRLLMLAKFDEVLDHLDATLAKG